MILKKVAQPLSKAPRMGVISGAGARLREMSGGPGSVDRASFFLARAWPRAVGREAHESGPGAD